jgi:hypothetical protein
MTLRSTMKGQPGSRAGCAAAATGVAARRAVGVLGALAFLLGCDPYVQGNGVFREETRNVGAFQGVSVADGLVATVRGGAADWTVVVSGDENVLQYVETRVAEGMLGVRMTNGVPFDSVNPVRVTVAAPAIGLLRANDSAAVIGAELAGESLIVEGSDGGDLRVAGAGGAILHVSLQGGDSGGAHLDARDYPVVAAVVELSGGARAELAVAAALSGTARGESVIEDHGEAVCSVVLEPDSVCGPTSSP